MKVLWQAVIGTMALAATAGIAAADRTDSVTVTVTSVREEQLALSIAAAGTVFSRQEAQITAGLLGRLEWVAEPGDVVALNEPVARFDCDLLELQREEQVVLGEREEIAHRALAREAERLSTLRSSGDASATQLDRVQADRDLAANALRIARVRVRQTNKQLERCVARAPFAGAITQRLQRAGEDVDRGTVIAHMTDTHHLEVRASVPIRHLPRLTVGGPVDARLSGVNLEGRIRKIVPAADPMSQTFEVRVEVPETAHHFVTAGQLVSVTLPLTASPSLTVPRDSIVLREDGAFVVRINDEGRAERVGIELADAHGERVAVSGALRAGDRVVVRGADVLDEGQSVSVQSET